MSIPIEDLIEKFAQGGLSAEEQVLFDQKFEEDPSFSEKAIQALGQRLGPAPNAFLDRMGQSARPAVENAWKKFRPAFRETASSGSTIPWMVVVPVLALVAALLGLAGAARYLILHPKTPAETTAPALVNTVPEVSTSANQVPEVAPEGGTQPQVVKAPKASSTGTLAPPLVREGHYVRFQDLSPTARLSIDILDEQGGLVRHLYEGAWKEGQLLDWDGRNAAGAPVKPGSYRARVKSLEGTFISQFIVK